jgi:sigma-B regulation protein RsbU (phosphoserine phosphatase)
LHCYTDGVIDVENDEGKDFGVERLRDFLTERFQSENIEEVHRQLINKLNAYKQSRNFTDDITLLSFRFKGN